MSQYSYVGLLIVGLLLRRTVETWDYRVAPVFNFAVVRHHPIVQQDFSSRFWAVMSAMRNN